MGALGISLRPAEMERYLKIKQRNDAIQCNPNFIATGIPLEDRDYTHVVSIARRLWMQEAISVEEMQE